jgi:hypothetical protein
MLETIDEAVEFFRTQLWSAAALSRWRRLSGLGGDSAEEALRRHLGLCLDLCHAGVEFEDPEACVSSLLSAGITIAKIQVTAGLRLSPADRAGREALRCFADPVYLHQVVVRDGSGLRRHLDLEEALEAERDEAAGDAEWRVHFHVPLFHGELGPFHSTRDFTQRVLERHRRAPLSAHLEVETYTWDVLPSPWRDRGVAEAIAAELDWVCSVLQA